MNKETNKPIFSWLKALRKIFSGQPPKDREELVELLHGAEHTNLLSVDALAMMEGVLQVFEMRVRDIMIPRIKMISVDYEATLDQLMPVITDSAHSRFPVLSANKEEVVGILLAKDLLPSFRGDNNAISFHVRDIMRAAIFIPESKRLNVLLKEFRANRNHIAIVVDEYGGIAGLVTIEDVLEQIVGDIIDEHDFDEEEVIKKFDDGRYIIKSLTPIDDFNEYFGSELSDEEFDTIGGLVLKAFGHLPKRHEGITLGIYQFKVLSADSRRINLLEMSIGELATPGSHGSTTEQSLENQQ